MTGKGVAESVVEAGLVGAMGAALGWWAVGLLTDSVAQVLGAIVGALNGVISGATGLYAWHRAKGWLFFVLDSTWGLIGNALALLLHAVNLVSGNPGYVSEMCVRTNRHVYEGGVGLRTGFALALGNVISNAGGAVGLRGESEKVIKRRKFVIAHEGVHVMQNRIFGPLYQLIYVGWMMLFGVIGFFIWLVRDRQELWQIVETMAYYNNPFEFWAYKNDRYWPPAGAHKRYAWGSASKTETL